MPKVTKQHLPLQQVALQHKMPASRAELPETVTVQKAMEEEIVNARLDARLKLELGVHRCHQSPHADQLEDEKITSVRWVDSPYFYDQLDKVSSYFKTLSVAALDAFEKCTDPVMKYLIRQHKHQALPRGSGKEGQAKMMGNGAKIGVNTATGKKIYLDYRQNYLVDDFAQSLSEVDGIPCGQMRLIWGGQQLEHGRTLQSYGIMPDSMIHLVLRMRGAKPVIYLYPPEPLLCKVDLQLAKFWDFTHIYPLPAKKPEPQFLSWEADARPNGDLVVTGNRHLKTKVPYLFWEAETNDTCTSPLFTLDSPDTMKMTKDSFVNYLDVVLVSYLYMDFKQASDLITWWLPSINKLPYIKFRFLTQGEINAAAPLHITPRPDIVHRVFLLFGPGDGKEKVGGFKDTDWQSVVVGDTDMTGWKKDKFSVLEWGGMFIDDGTCRMSQLA